MNTDFDETHKDEAQRLFRQKLLNEMAETNRLLNIIISVLDGQSDHLSKIRSNTF